MHMQHFLEALRSHHTSNADLILTLLGLAAVVIFLVLRTLRQQTIIAELQRRKIHDTFLELCHNRDLLADEIRYLAQFEATLGEGLVSLFQSNVAFDKFVCQVLTQTPTDKLPGQNELLSNLRRKLGFRPPSCGSALNSTRELALGQVLYLVFPNDLFLEGSVIEVDETKFLVNLHAGSSQPFPIVTGMPVRLHFNRVGDARYSGTTYILHVISTFEGLIVTLHHAEGLKRDQRRQDFRVDESRVISFWLITPEEVRLEDPREIIAERTPERATLSDLSGGGASLIFKRDLPIHQRMYLNLDLTGAYDLPFVRASVIRAVRRTTLSCWCLSVRFEDLRPSERQKLVRHVFLQEREFMKSVWPMQNVPVEETIRWE